MPKLMLAANPIQIDIVVEDIVKALLIYDSIQVWRSTDNQVTFTEITSYDDLPAIIDCTNVGPWSVSGKVLTIIKNNSEPFSITFTGTDPVDLLTIIKKINSYYPDTPQPIASQVPTNTNKLRLTSDVLGSESNFTISGNAASVFSFPSNKVIGFEHRILLTSPTTQYRFYDLDGQPTYYYKIRFYHSKTGAVSPFSSVIIGRISPILSDSDLVTASITISDLNGNPLEGKRILIVPINVNKIGPVSLTSTQDRIVIKTDQFGYASTKLAKGQLVRVYIEGSGFEREFIVPNANFDIMTVATTKPDPFNIITTPPLAIRISL